MNNVVSGVTRFRCFFEQSGTFKNEFIKLGYDAFDYDILNDFGETDYKCDLFNEIKCAYRGEGSIFDQFNEDDFIFAFFPCVRFCGPAEFLVRASSHSFAAYDDLRKIETSMKYEHERSLFYQLFCKLCVVCIRKKLRLIIENPYASASYLVRYFPIPPKVVDTNRRDRGDAFKKPTMFFFINCVPSDNFIFESVAYHDHRKVEGCSTVERSMITKDYANRFIREFIL